MRARNPQHASQYVIRGLRTLNPTLDDRNFAILKERARAYANRTGPRVGDFVQMPDGMLLRFTHDWTNDIQTTHKEFPTDASFYLGHSGVSFSGTLDAPILKSKLRDTGETRPGTFWFFRNNFTQAHNGTSVRIPCPVWTVEP